MMTSSGAGSAGVNGFWFFFIFFLQCSDASRFHVLIKITARYHEPCQMTGTRSDFCCFHVTVEPMRVLFLACSRL